MKKILFFVATLFAGLLYGQTNVSADITSSTTWTTSGSPYTITTPINIDSAATLSIDPGVEVRFDAGVRVMVHGRLIALGTLTDSIFFIGTGPSTNRRNRISFDGEIQLAYVDVTNMNQGFNADYSSSSTTPRIPNGPIFSVNHGYFHGNNFGLSLYPFTSVRFQVDSSLFDQNSYGMRGSHCDIADCIFRRNGAGIVDMWNSTITRTVCHVNGSGIGCTPPMQITDCDIRENAFGIRLSLSTTGANGVLSNLTGNQLLDNGIGIITYRDSGLYDLQLLNISGNEICSDSFNIRSQGFAAPVSTPILDVSDNCWCQWDSLGVDSMIQNHYGAPITIMPLDSSCLPSLVFPGDANHDQIANNFDLLPVGLYFNQTGTARPNASNSWIGQRAADWNVSQANGRDIKHADCNGDGTINWSDTLAINLNYGLTHNSWRGAAAGNGTSIRFSMPTSNLNPGDTVSIPIELGYFDTLAMNIYGIAFSVNYDVMIVDSASARLDYSNSWLGTKNTDLLTLDKDFPTLGQLDIALVRNNQQNRTGYGSIADLIVVISDDLSKRELPFVLEFSNIRAVDSAGQEIAVRAEAGEATIETEPTLSIDSDFAQALKAYPNPIDDQLHLSHPQYTFLSVSLISMNGQQQVLWQGAQRQRLELKIPEQAPGIYLLVVDMKEGRKTLKVELR